MDVLLIVAGSVIGAFIACTLACVPGLHIFNVLGILVVGAHAAAGHGFVAPMEFSIAVTVGLVVGYALLNTIPSVLLAAPDESALFTVLPGQKFLLAGRGYEGVMITLAGGAAALVGMLLFFGALAPFILPSVHRVFRGHAHWVLWCVIAFMLMSEWPKPRPSGQAGVGRLLDSWACTGMGIGTFLLSGLLGFILLFRSPVPTDAAFQSLMPAFVGLFTIPWLLLNIVTSLSPPKQDRTGCVDLSMGEFGKGTCAGILGGGFAAFFPVVTGGVGGLLAGHASAIRNDRTFLVSQGASKQVYYVGGLLLLFVPQLGISRGGASAMLKGLVTPMGSYEYLIALSAMALSGCISILLASPLTILTLRLIERWGYRTLSLGALAAACTLVAAMTGAMGIGIMCVACGIGLIPVLWGSRRMNCLGVILLPMACNMSGVGPSVAKWLGLL